MMASTGSRPRCICHSDLCARRNRSAGKARAPAIWQSRGVISNASMDSTQASTVGALRTPTSLSASSMPAYGARTAASPPGCFISGTARVTAAALPAIRRGSTTWCTATVSVRCAVSQRSLRRMPEAIPVDLSPYGSRAPGLLDRATLALTRAMPNNWLGLRFAILFRRMVTRRLGRGALDTELWGMRLRLYALGNGCEKNALFTPQMFDVMERGVLSDAVDRRPDA